MDGETIRALIALIKTGGFVNVTCQREYDPPIVEIDLPAGLAINVNYNLYEQIREAAGLPEGVCNEDNTYS